MARHTGGATLTFERTGLWQTAFGKKKSDVTAFYSGHLRDLRERARVLVDRIRSDIPFLTVHDLTHLDAIWEVASVIAGPSYPITAAEGFVFGASVLLHDAAMCVGAFPGGLAEISQTNEWKDTVDMLFRETRGTRPSPEEISKPPGHIIEHALPKILRLLHTSRAEQLPRTKWINAAGEPEYLIENADLREFYGSLIGKIARSHGESVFWVQSELGKSLLGALPSHDGGEVSGLKLACLLRVADAAQIDARRAPALARTITKPKGISDVHWAFQGKLAKPRAERDALIYTSGSPFSLAEADAWWECFDALQVAQRELKDVDAILEDSPVPRLKARKVRNTESPRALSQHIQTHGWSPVDARVKISDIPRLVQMFGGARLYDDPKVAIRELIQNAADAIRARRKLDPAFAMDGGGEILVRLCKRDGTYWLSVEDDGIGMSERTITGTLLDFGRSFWTTDDVQNEFPGLMAKGMTPSGKFGIGFFSVFMVGDVVRVTSRRFDSASSDTRTLEFRGGLSLRPILRTPLPDEALPHGGTSVAVMLRSSPFGKGGLLATEDIFGAVRKHGLAKTVAAMCPSLDVSVSVDLKGRSVPIIKADDWLRIKSAKLLARIGARREDKNDTNHGANLRLIRSGQSIYGRASINPSSFSSEGIITVGGIGSEKLGYADGILLGTTEVLTRDSARRMAPASALAQWADEQAEIIAHSRMAPDDQCTAAGVVLACGGNPGKLPVGHIGGRYLNSRQLGTLVRTRSEITVFYGEPSFDEDTDGCHPREFKSSFEPSSDVLFLGEILGTGPLRPFRWGLTGCDWWPGTPSYRSILEAALQRRWKRYKAEQEEKVIGHVGGEDISRDVEIFRHSHEAKEP